MSLFVIKLLTFQHIYTSLDKHNININGTNFIAPKNHFHNLGLFSDTLDQHLLQYVGKVPKQIGIKSKPKTRLYVTVCELHKNTNQDKYSNTIKCKVLFVLTCTKIPKVPTPSYKID